MCGCFAIGFSFGKVAGLKGHERHEVAAERLRAELAVAQAQQAELEALANAAVWMCAGMQGQPGPWVITELSGGWYEARLMLRPEVTP